MSTTFRRSLALGVAGIAILALAACADDSAPAGTPFTQALARDYTDLANQTAAMPAPQSDEGFFDSAEDAITNPFGLFGPNDNAGNPNDLLVKAYTAKADLANQGEEPAPEAPGGPDAQGMHDRLLRAIAAGKERFPEPAARAQADYDCWVLDSGVPGFGATAQACRNALNTSLVTLENGARPAPPPMAFPVAPIAPVAPPPVAQTADYTVYFDFDSWTLTAEDLTVITNVINTARSGGQSHITVVGHTDTSGAADYNQKLSVKRANVVVEALVDMGARRAAIQASGAGESGLAVQTPDNTKEAKNRRAVVDLQP